MRVTSQSLVNLSSDLFVGKMSDGDGVARAFGGTGTTTLAQGWINISCPSQSPDSGASFLIHNLGDTKRAGAGTGEATNAFIRVYFCNYST